MLDLVQSRKELQLYFIACCLFISIYIYDPVKEDEFTGKVNKIDNICLFFGILYYRTLVSIDVIKTI